jgi:hypothetical protein
MVAARRNMSMRYRIAVTVRDRRASWRTISTVHTAVIQGISADRVRRIPIFSREMHYPQSVILSADPRFIDKM